MHNITLISGQSFAADEGETILNAALRSGLPLEYSCKTGRCGSCKSQVNSGETVISLAELGLSNDERAKKWVLTCARSATTDLMIDAQVLDADLPPSRLTPAKVDTIEQLAPDVVKIRLRLPPAAPLKWLAGQYLDVLGKDGIKRSYSIANAAPEAGSAQVELHIRQVPNGAMSAYWFGQAKPGDLLRIQGPIGTFFLRKQTPAKLLLLATGTGIAPIKALLDDLARRPASEQPEQITLLWGNRHPADFYLDDTAFGPNVVLHKVLSGADAGWSGARGRIQQHPAVAEASLADTAVYACGSPAMIDDARTLLTSRGLPTGSFHSDAFVCSI